METLRSDRALDRVSTARPERPEPHEGPLVRGEVCLERRGEVDHVRVLAVATPDDPVLRAVHHISGIGRGGGGGGGGGVLWARQNWYLPNPVAGALHPLERQMYGKMVARRWAVLACHAACTPPSFSGDSVTIPR